MAINIQSLFQDIIETPAQRQQRMLQEGILKGRELTSGLTGLARTQAPLVAAMAMNMPQQQEALRRGIGGMLGLDVRSESEKVQDALKNVDPNNPQSLLQAAQMIQGLGLGTQAAQLRQMAADVTRQKEADLLAKQQASTNIAKDLQSISESTERERANVESRLLAQQQREQELTAFETQQKAEKLAIEEAEFRLEKLKQGKSTDEIFGGQEVLPNGAIYYASKSGDTIVKDIDGNVLTGDEARKALDEGFAIKSELERNIYQARRLGTQSAIIAYDSFEKIGTNRAMISNLREAANLVEQGAATTEIEAFLRPLNQATNFLKQKTGELTLNQLSQVTMGALSEKELELLQQTAAPGGFNKSQIIQWYREKADATEKALGILEEQAVYFSQEGATPGGWLEKQKQIKGQQRQVQQDSSQERVELLRTIRGDNTQQTGPGTGGRTGRRSR